MKTRAPSPTTTAPISSEPVATASIRPPTPSINLLSLPIHAAERGVSTVHRPLPHLERVQSAFGHHDISNVRSTIGSAPAALDANAYTLGDRVAFARAPDVHLAAHEAAHVVQQRAGIAPSPEHEHHADRVADAVARGHSAESLLDRVVPNAAPAPVLQFDRDEDKASDAAIIAILERAVAKGDSKGAKARVRDLTALLLTLPAKKALVLAVRMSKNKPDDKVAHLIDYKLSRSTKAKLIAMLYGQWGMKFGWLGAGSDPAPKVAAAPPPPKPAEPAEPDPRWASDVEMHVKSLETANLLDGKDPTYGELERLVGRLERDDLKLDDELINLAHLKERFKDLKMDHAQLRLILAVRLEMFLEGFAYLGTSLPPLKRARAFLDAHSHEFVVMEDHVAEQVVTGLLSTPGYMTQPVLTVNNEVAVRRIEADPDKIYKEAAINIITTPFLALAELIPALKAMGGFVVGVPLGALDAIEDLVEAGLANLKAAMSLMASLFTGKFLKQIYELCVKIYDFIANLPQIASALGEWFAHEWRTAGAFGKGELVGKIVGYIAMTIAIGILTEGKSLEYTGGRLQKIVVKVLKLTEKIANPFTYVKPFVKPAARILNKIPGVERGIAATSRAADKLGKVTAPARRLVGRATKFPKSALRFLRGVGKNVDNAAEVAEGRAGTWEEKFWLERDAARAGDHAMPSMATIEAAPAVAEAVTPTIAREAHDLTPVMVDGEIWLRICSKKCGPLLGKLEATEKALANVSDDAREKVRGLIDRTKSLQDDWDNLDPAATEKRLDELSNELEALGKSDPSVGKAIADGELPGVYSTQIEWGIAKVDARPAPPGYWGRRNVLNDARADAFERKINPNNESYFLPAGDKDGFVQFENLAGNIVQDGKCITAKKSIYHVADMPSFATEKVLAEARRQVAAATKAGKTVEWLVSEQKAVTQLTDLFTAEGVAVTVSYFPE